MKSKELLIIQAGTPPAEIQESVGDLPQWFAAALGMGVQDFDIVRVFENEPLPEHGAHSVVVITGSWSMVTDLHPWSETTAKWIQQADALKIPMFGVCYGHQLMAHAFGGEVGYLESGREMGCLEIERTNNEEDSLLVGLPSTFKAHLTHMQTVIKIPNYATVLARSKQDLHQIVRYSETSFSTQFHPEFTPQIATACIHTREEVLRKEGMDPNLMLAELETTPVPLIILKRFIQAHIGTSR